MKSEAYKLSIVAPAYNEEACIDEVVKGWITYCALLPFPCEIVVVNDGSSDQTGPILHQLSKKYPNLKIISYDSNGGYGAALSSAIAHSQGEWILTIDSDGQFAIEDLTLLWEEVHENSAACAAGFRKKEDHFLRVFADRVLRLFCRVLFGRPCKDPNCALKLVRGSLLRSLTLESRGFSSPSEIFFKLNALGIDIIEIPVQHYPRTSGISKLKFFETAWKMAAFLLYLRFKIFLHQKGILYLSKLDRRENSQPTTTTGETLKYATK